MNNINGPNDILFQTFRYWTKSFIGKLCDLCLLLIITAILPTGCKKFVDVDTPPVSISQQNVYSNDKTAITVLTGLFYDGLGADMSKYCGLLADEFSLWDGAGPEISGYYTNSLVSTDAPGSSTGKETWESYYNSIYRCNAALEGLTLSTSLTPSVKKQLIGEAYFMRAWFYFYLVNLYGAVPLAITTDAEVNRLLPRAPVSKVYEQIKADLQNAQEYLNSAFVDGRLSPYNNSPERVRPTKWAATAMLARVYLYTKDFANAEAEATKVINQHDLFELLEYAAIFKKNSLETIWQIQPTAIGSNTAEGRAFHLGADPAGFDYERIVYLSSFILNEFEAGDQRRQQWVDSLVQGTEVYYYPVKYKEGGYNPLITSVGDLTEYSMMLRLAEQYLIRAEARARQGNLLGAISDLDIIRERAELPLISDSNPGVNQNELINLILHERQVELFGEWGHRWFDLKRSGKVTERMEIVTPLKGGEWKSTDELLPIPYNEILLNGNLVQNLGY